VQGAGVEVAESASQGATWISASCIALHFHRQHRTIAHLCELSVAGVFAAQVGIDRGV